MNKNKGFTLIELIIVVAFIGILVGTATPQLKKSFDNLEFESFVKDIFYLSQYLRSTAVNEANTYFLGFNKQEQEMQGGCKENNIFKNIGGKLSKPFKVPRGVIVYFYPAVRNDVYFYPDGSADKVNINFENSYGRKISLAINGLTGEIQMH